MLTIIHSSVSLYIHARSQEYPKLVVRSFIASNRCPAPFLFFFSSGCLMNRVRCIDPHALHSSSLRSTYQPRQTSIRCDMMRHDAKRCEAMRCDAMRCDEMRRCNSAALTGLPVGKESRREEPPGPGQKRSSSSACLVLRPSEMVYECILLLPLCPIVCGGISLLGSRTSLK